MIGLTKEQMQLKQEIVSLSATYLNKEVAQRDSQQIFDKELWEKCGELGLQGLPIPEEYGGKGLDVLSTMKALEALGYACRDNGLTFAIGAHLLACVVPIWLFGRAEQKEKYLPLLCNGEWIAANAITEAESGSNAFQMKAVASKQNEAYVATASKTYCSNGPVADMVLMYMMTDPQKGAMGGVSGFLLERNKGQFESSEKVDKMGLRSCMMGDVSVPSDAEIPFSAVLGKEGGGLQQFITSMTWERIGLSAIHLGSMQRLLEEAAIFVKARKVNGRAIAEYQAVSHKLAEFRTELRAAKLMTYQAVQNLQDGKNALIDAAMAKLYVSEVYKKHALHMLQVYGAKGYSGQSEVERSVRDATASTLYSGTSEVLRNIIAKDLIKY